MLVPRNLLAVLVLAVTLLAVGLTAVAAPEPVGSSGERQKSTDGKKRSEEEDDPPPAKDKGGKKRSEEEDESPPPRAKTKDRGSKKRAEEEEPKGNAKSLKRLDEEADKQATPPPAATSDLGKAAAAAKHRGTKKLFNDLAVPHDLVTPKRLTGVTVEGGAGSGKSLRVELLPEYIGDLRDLDGPLRVIILDEEGKHEKEDSFSPGRVLGIKYYEQIAVDKVKEFLNETYWKLDPASPPYLSRYNQLLVAEQALSAVLRVHQSAREREVRKGDGWDAVENPLRTQLLDVLLQQMDQLAESKAWDPAFEMARRVVDTFTRPGDHKLIAPPLAGLLDRALKDPTYGQDRLKEARMRLKFLEDQFPDSAIIKPLSERLQNQARVLFERAREAWKEKKQAEAMALSIQAQEVWPELPGLRQFRTEIDSAYGMLEVGVRELPSYFSPGWACLDSEHRAVDLMFESLVCLTPAPEGGLYYRPMLAEGRPRVEPLGRLLKLPRHVRWSDGRDMTIGDVRFTAGLLQRPPEPSPMWLERSTAWGDMIDSVRSEGDAFRVKLRLRQGMLDPMAAMSFKVLPMRMNPHAASEKFARNPITSGPFRFGGKGSDLATGRECIRFMSNPDYGARMGKAGLPRIKEVRFYAVTDPVGEMRANPVRLDLALDLNAEQASELMKDPKFEVPMPVRGMNRRVYFLAVNHRRPALANAELRLALALAIGREDLLDKHFRKDLGKKVHRALNGPFPAATWACDPTLVSRTNRESLDPVDVPKARQKLAEWKGKTSRNSETLTLKYPSGNPDLAGAMTALCEQVNKELDGLKLIPEARTPYDLRKDVEETYSYDLAYYHHDFVDETYWLYPLLGPTGRGGGPENYLGYTGALVAKIQAAVTLRDFSKVREYAHAIHKQFLETEMPMIPLWQLDPLYAYRKNDVEMPELIDPVSIFTRIEEWKRHPR